MLTLENPRYEAFAQARARGPLLIDADESAGSVRRRGHPSRLAWKPEVAERIADQRRIGKDFKFFTAIDLSNEPPENQADRAQIRPAAAPSAPRQRPFSAPPAPRALPPPPHQRPAVSPRAPLLPWGRKASTVKTPATPLTETAT